MERVPSASASASSSVWIAIMLRNSLRRTTEAASMRAKSWPSPSTRRVWISSRLRPSPAVARSISSENALLIPNIKHLILGRAPARFTCLGGFGRFKT